MMLLIVTESHESNRLLARCLSHDDYQVWSAVDRSEALAILARDDHPAVVILEWPLADDVATRFSRLLQEKRQNSFVYILLLIRQTPLSWLSEVPAWADGFLSEPFDEHELKIRVRASFRIWKLQSDLVNQ